MIVSTNPGRPGAPGGGLRLGIAMRILGIAMRIASRQVARSDAFVSTPVEKPARCSQDARLTVRGRNDVYSSSPSAFNTASTCRIRPIRLCGNRCRRTLSLINADLSARADNRAKSEHCEPRNPRGYDGQDRRRSARPSRPATSTEPCQWRKTTPGENVGAGQSRLRGDAPESEFSARLLCRRSPSWRPPLSICLVAAASIGAKPHH